MRRKTRGSTPLTGWVLTAVVVVGPGCNKEPVCDTLADCGVNGGSGDDSSTGSPPQLPVNRDVDILFVIDNSGSMGAAQAKLAATLPSLIEVLESDELDANYRIGITTTDNGNPWCEPDTTTPEHGDLVLSSCATRLGDFSVDGLVDAADLACNDICTLGPAELEILPTTTDDDPVARPRPWLENIEGKQNLPDGVDIAQALACFAPQGVNGCGFESPLESLYLALDHARTPGHPSYGFIRPDAVLAVVFVTDAADCSYNQDWAEIFSADGDQTFWSDPEASAPTSALCWNAGVDCSGDPSGYDTCDPANKDVDGNIGVGELDSVLHPMSRYTDLLALIQEEKQQLNYNQEVVVALIGGVDSAGEAFYRDVSETDPAFQASFGIGPGCEALPPAGQLEPTQAVPPVRLRALVDGSSPGAMFSICADDYAPTLAAIANRIKEQMPPSCYRHCVKDSDPTTAILDPDCTVEEHRYGMGGSSLIDECLRNINGYVIDPISNDYTMPAPDINVCYAMRTDALGATASPDDDITPACSENGSNLEFKLVRRPGFPAPGGAAIVATCSLADFPEVECAG